MEYKRHAKGACKFKNAKGHTRVYTRGIQSVYTIGNIKSIYTLGVTLFILVILNVLMPKI